MYGDPNSKLAQMLSPKYPNIPSAEAASSAELKEHMADDVLHVSFIYEGKRYTINSPYVKGGQLSLKGQLHSHTTNSDGVNSPSALVTAYKSAGYDFVSITDHDYLTPNPNVAGIIFINGVEDTFNRHITAYDITTQSTDTNVQTVINYYRALSKLCSIAHPNWANTRIEKSEMQGYYDYNFIEVYNATTNTFAEERWDWVLSSGKKVFALAVDDCHNIAGSDFNRGYVVVNAPSKNKELILQSLRDGNFYASTGNDISISVNGQEVTALSSGLSNFTFIGFNGRVLKTVNGVTTASYTIKGDELYVRVKSVKVSDSTIAWSQPIFIDCLGDDGRLQITKATSNVDYVLLSKTIAQSVARDTLTIIDWQGVVKDTRGFFNPATPTRITIPAGVTKAIVKANLRTERLISDKSRLYNLFFIRKNGANFIGMPATTASTLGNIGTTGVSCVDLNMCSSIVEVTEGDYFEVFAYHLVDTSIDIPNSPVTWFSLEVVEG